MEPAPSLVLVLGCSVCLSSVLYAAKLPWLPLTPRWWNAHPHPQALLPCRQGSCSLEGVKGLRGAGTEGV